MNNKKLGNDFEKECAEMLKKNGYWVTYMTPKQHIGSQPMDIIASKNNIIYCFECKTLQNKYKRFPISRIEENQKLAYKKLMEAGTYNYFLIVKCNDEEIYAIPFSDINFNEKAILMEDKYKMNF